ncbi:Homeobox-leucine zipper protein ROC8 [Apostasia shenzhenica]|uniref:Homeobox-leucine zipper protein ROC8 n=1 Tax=Apostasia shenzhenica TaxID=1088818 RepID=A0A2I0BAT4_9ASPA|nr:Homeobox-leucine zipper protein ROC8 [Apostasia shenzhenica]
MDSSDEQDVSDSQRKKKRYHRHTPRQIQELEALFKVCPHPDEKQRMQLSLDLGLEPRQIKFWFQNRRTQMKAQHERADNCSLRAENDKIRCENIAMREALKNVICPSCGSPQASEDSYFDEQKLRMENARLKDELDRVSTITSKYLGRPVTQLPPIQTLSGSSLDLTVGSYGSTGFTPSAISETEKQMMIELATQAMEELIRLAQTDEPLWTRFGSEGREMLNLETYEKIFSRPVHQFRSPDTRIETSRDSGDVMMSSLHLVDMFMNSVRYMYSEFLGLSPVVPSREFCFLRYCQQIEQDLWVITDVSVDLPSGSLIQDMPNGYSKIVWVELMEIEEKNVTHQLYHDLVDSGIAFGAQRWVATLQRMCERIACLTVTGDSPRDQWDVLSNGKAVREVTRIANGQHPGNCISLFRVNPSNPNESNMLILQESCTDPSGSLIVYVSIDPTSINIAMSGEDPSFIPLLPSGFVVLPDGRPSFGSHASSSSNPMGGSSGSVLTIAFQIMVSSLPSAKLNLESVATVNHLIGATVQHIKAALSSLGTK